MHGDTTGVVATDPRGEDDDCRRWRDALTLFNAAAKAACDLNFGKLQREAEDAAAICVREITQANQPRLALGEGVSGSQTVHGQDPEDAEVKPAWSPGYGDRP